MELNINSFGTKLYQWFYGVRTYNLPNNLCPYFWKTVLMYLTIIPYTLFCLPVVIYDLFDKSYENGDRTVGERMGVSFGVYIGLFVISSLLFSISGLFIKFEPKSFFEAMMLIGTLVWAALAVIGVIEGAKYLREYSTSDKSYYDREQDTWVVKKTKFNMTTEFIKAKYNKYCPKIEWKGDDDRG